MEDNYDLTIPLKKGAMVCVGMSALSKSTPDLKYYMLMIVYFKQRQKYGDTVYKQTNIPFTDDIVINTFLENVERCTLFFKSPLNTMPLLLNSKTLSGVIAKYRLKNNV